MEPNNNSNEPIILGTLRKEKSSKPIFVFVVLFIILSVTFGLPYIENYMKDPNTFLGKIYYYVIPEEKEEVFIPTEESIYSLNENTTIKFNSLVLTNFALKNNTITYFIKSFSNNHNLDEDYLYLEISGSSGNILKRIKLTGIVSNTEEERILSLSDINFNPSVTYNGKILKIEEKDYDKATINSDESGIGDLICEKDLETYEYMFINHKLKRIIHSLKYNNITDIDKYLEKYQTSSDITKKIISLGAESSTIETAVGYNFTANLDLDKIKISDLKEFINYNYYELDTTAHRVKFEMEAKGFECK